MSNVIGTANETNAQQFFHGTKAQLNLGDLIEPGFNSNYGKQKKALYVYFSATKDAAIWGAELALGSGPERIYVVEPIGTFEDDPNLTDKKFPGNPTKSYRTRDSLLIIGEVPHWQGHSPELITEMENNIERLNQLGIEAIEN